MNWLPPLRLEQPLFLALLFLLPLIWMGWRASVRSVLFWRSLIFGLLVLALTGPEVLRSTTQVSAPREERIVAIDLSRSIPAATRAWMERTIKEKLVPSGAGRWIVFAGNTSEVREWRPWLTGETASAAIQPEQTNLETLFAQLISQGQTPRSLFLLTDGWENQGEVERLLPALTLSNIKVFPLLPTEPVALPDVEVKKVVAPHHGVSGESISVRIVVENHNQGDVEGMLSLRRNGEPFKDERVRLKPGSQILTYQTILSGGTFNSFQATYTAAKANTDLYSQNNRAVAWISVQAKEKVLILSGQAGQGRYLEEILRRRGFEVTAVVPNGQPPAPTGFSVVIFNNVEREKVPSSYLAAIERHVASGNAFLMLGADHSFGPGGYRQTAIETVLPVEVREPKKEEKNRAFVLVIDKSGSMRDDNRILYAKEAAKGVVNQLKDNDLLGVVGFDVSPFVVVPLTSVERLRGTIGFQIDRLKAGGRTYLWPALIEAKRLLERESADRKYVIILSDGETGGSQGDYIDLVSVMKKESKITVSAVAIGDQANIPLLKRISQYGGGFFHHTYDPRTLPQLVAQQVREIPEAEIPIEREYLPIPVRSSALLASFRERTYPPVRGFIETEIKRGAHLDLMVSKDEKRFPLLASWSYGRGRTVAFTTDLQGYWTRSWISWSGLEDFWSGIFDWLRPPKESVPPHEVRINMGDRRPVMDLYVFEEGNAGSQFRYSVSGKEAKSEGLMKRVAPGRYQADLPISTPGDYRIELAEDRSGQRIPYPAVGYTMPFRLGSEIPRQVPNLALLEKLARATGGEINPRPQQIGKSEEVILATEPLRGPLIFGAAILFLLEIIFRRFLPALVA